MDQATEEQAKRFVQGIDRKVGIGRRWQEASIYELAQYSPQLALARAMGVPLAPYHLNIRASFTDSTTATTNPASFENGNTSITQPSICDQIVYSMNSNGAFPGDVFKTLSDYFYQLTSGIQATMEVQGQPKYAVAPYYTPMNALLSGLAEGWPLGWVLNYNQTISMQFQQTVPVPFPPLNIVVTFRLWQPTGTDDFQMLTAYDARARLMRDFGLTAPPANISPGLVTPGVAR
jgi:hypothetical protein